MIIYLHSLETYFFLAKQKCFSYRTNAILVIGTIIIYFIKMVGFMCLKIRTSLWRMFNIDINKLHQSNLVQNLFLCLFPNICHTNFGFLFSTKWDIRHPILIWSFGKLISGFLWKGIYILVWKHVLGSFCSIISMNKINAYWWLGFA